jgi:hypothetical protein
MCPSGGCADKNFVFWVVTWLEGQDGNGDPVLVDELLDHGLRGDLNALLNLKSISDICPNASCNSSCGICMEEFTNNVGFYHVPFLVAPATTEATAASRPTQNSSGGGLADLTIERVSVSPAVVQPGQKAVVRAGLRALGLDIDGQIVRFYAIPPGGGELTLQEALERYGSFDEEILPRIRGDRVHEAQVPFLPTDLGRYQILVSALRGGQEQLLGEVDLEVVETAPATPTATPVKSKGNGDGCAISERPGDGSTKALSLLMVPLLFGLLRRRLSKRGYSRGVASK